MNNRVRYPLGKQTFANIIEGGYLYIDKTAYIYDITHRDSNYIFLARPRRFGKSLLVSTLKAYFQGRKELFKGLAIEKLEKEWEEFPVIHLDMSGGKHLEKEPLERYLFEELNNNAERLGVNIPATPDTNIGMTQLIQSAYKKHGKKVVFLLDEYDAPLLDVVHKGSELEEMRQVMRNFYSPIKECDGFIHFVFITGITKFSQLSIFSELNNLDKISMLEEYAGICGITENELITQMGEGISALAEKQGITKDEAIVKLKENYDGYHFSWPSPDVYNPFSLLNSLAKKDFGAYWFESGTPTFLLESLKKFKASPLLLSSPLKAKASSFDAPIEGASSITPLLYQTGYVTIKDCSPTGLYTLDIPNKEIRIGLMESLLPHYINDPAVCADETLDTMQTALLNEDIDTFFNTLKTFLDTVPGVDNVDKPEHFEAHWQRMLFVIFSLLGSRCDVEVRTPKGRVDMVARTAHHLYLMELKVKEGADAAMEQIDLKNYSKRFALCGLPVVKIGVGFSEEDRNITKWVVEV